jgi:hypothetical protein
MDRSMVPALGSHDRHMHHQPRKRFLLEDHLDVITLLFLDESHNTVALVPRVPVRSSMICKHDLLHRFLSDVHLLRFKLPSQ